MLVLKAYVENDGRVWAPTVFVITHNGETMRVSLKKRDGDTQGSCHVVFDAPRSFVIARDDGREGAG